MKKECTRCGTKHNAYYCPSCGSGENKDVGGDNTGAIIGATIGFLDDGIAGAVIGGLIGSMFDDD